MNKNLIFGVGGLLIGAVSGGLASWAYCKKKYEQQAKDEIAEMREYYGNKVRNMKSALNVQYGMGKSDYVDTDNVAAEDEEDEVAVYRERDGVSFYLEDPAESEYPEEDEEETDGTEEIIAEYEKNKNQKPKIISVDEYGSLPPGTGTETLFLYTYDDTITDENDEEIVDYERLLGDCLDQYDFFDSDERVIFVMNYELSTCYEISKIEGAWSGR